MMKISLCKYYVLENYRTKKNSQKKMLMQVKCGKFVERIFAMCDSILSVCYTFGGVYTLLLCTVSIALCTYNCVQSVSSVLCTNRTTLRPPLTQYISMSVYCLYNYVKRKRKKKYLSYTTTRFRREQQRVHLCQLIKEHIER